MREAEITKTLALEEQKRNLVEAATDEGAARALKDESKRNLLQLNVVHVKQIITANRVEEENLRAPQAAKKVIIKQAGELTILLENQRKVYLTS